MARRFGVEIEMVGITREQAVRAMRLVGINVQSESYNHRTQGHWKIVPDGSVLNGFEVVSPVLEGENGLEQLRAVITALDDMGGKVNRSCGYHVHFDAADLSVEHIRTIVTRYAAFESQIDAFMPRSRRGNNNTYCRSLSAVVDSPRFRSASTLRDLISAQPGRYFKVNLQAYHAHGTIEFRQHSGTLNAPKAVNWVRLMDAFITESKARVDAPAAAPVAASVPAAASAAPVRLSGVTQALYRMLQNGPVALDAMCGQFGWQPHTGRAAVTRLRRAGYRVTSARGSDGLLRYNLVGRIDAPAGVANPAPRSAAPAPRRDLIGNLYDGVAEPLRIFYRNRAAVLAAA